MEAWRHEVSYNFKAKEWIEKKMEENVVQLHQKKENLHFFEQTVAQWLMNKRKLKTTNLTTEISNHVL